jgi:hypothetical protein
VEGVRDSRVGIKGLMPAEWLWTMDWPLKVVSKEINIEYAWDIHT